MGMQEYREGGFGPIKPVDESLRDLLENTVEQARTKALHIGTVEALEQMAKGLPEDDAGEPLARILQAEFDKLRADVNKIMARLGIDGD